MHHVNQDMVFASYCFNNNVTLTNVDDSEDVEWYEVADDQES